MNLEILNTKAIQQLLDKVRGVDASIGSYQEHSFLEDQFTCSVKLTNGRIKIYIEELEDEEALPYDRIKDIAARFIDKE